MVTAFVIVALAAASAIVGARAAQRNNTPVTVAAIVFLFGLAGYIDGMA